MKKLAMGLMVLILATSAANGAYLSLQFTDHHGINRMFAAPGSTVSVDVVWEFTPDVGYGNNDIVGVIFQLEATNAILTGQSTDLPGWITTGTSGPLAGSHQFASTANLGAQIAGPGQLIIGTMEITVDPSIIHDPIELTFMHDTVLLPSSPAGIGYNYPDKAENLPKVASYSGMYAYGLGCPHTTTSKGGTIQEANPLIIEIPEPASLSLLALGGLVLIRRR